MARVRFIVDDVEQAVDFYVSNLGFEIESNFAPAIAILVSGRLNPVGFRAESISVHVNAGWHGTQSGWRLE